MVWHGRGDDGSQAALAVVNGALAGTGERRRPDLRRRLGRRRLVSHLGARPSGLPHRRSGVRPDAGAGRGTRPGRVRNRRTRAHGRRRSTDRRDGGVDACGAQRRGRHSGGDPEPHSVRGRQCQPGLREQRRERTPKSRALRRSELHGKRHQRRSPVAPEQVRTAPTCTRFAISTGPTSSRCLEMVMRARAPAGLASTTTPSTSFASVAFNVVDQSCAAGSVVRARGGSQRRAASRPRERRGQHSVVSRRLRISGSGRGRSAPCFPTAARSAYLSSRIRMCSTTGA